MDLGAQFVILGTGEEVLEEKFKKKEKKYPHNISINITFDNTLAHQIEAGADMFLMPSRYEPCGLNQIYSLTGRILYKKGFKDSRGQGFKGLITLLNIKTVGRNTDLPLQCNKIFKATSIKF